MNQLISWESKTLYCSKSFKGLYDWGQNWNMNWIVIWLLMLSKAHIKGQKRTNQMNWTTFDPKGHLSTQMHLWGDLTWRLLHLKVHSKLTIGVARAWNNKIRNPYPRKGIISISFLISKLFKFVLYNFYELLMFLLLFIQTPLGGVCI